MTRRAGPLGVSGLLARQRGPHARAAVRDIPGSCACRWEWDPGGERWRRLYVTVSCTWHALSTATRTDVGK